MPGFDGTGPRGMGPMTGGGRGFCTSGRRYNASYLYRPRRGMGGGYRYSEVALPAPSIAQEESLSSLREEVSSLKKEIGELKESLKKLPDNK